MRMPIRSVVVAVAAAVVVLSAGCRPDDEIRTYTAPKSATPTVAAPPAGEDKERTLGAILLAGDKYSFFVKLRGPVGVIAPLESDFDSFVGSIKVNGPDAPPTWAAPPAATWREGPAKQLRLVTYQTGPADAPTEMVLSGPFSGSVLENVNRWRGEVGLRKLTEGELADGAKELTVNGGKVYRVDVKGPGGKGGMMPPFGGK